ncbi:uncharacterized protein [Drosophila suzukii]|uniref:Uncharacterized protein n=1 Tax=Drosophila suzukii TaxID=28584 RepID=A0ABM4TW18_DROSZ
MGTIVLSSGDSDGESEPSSPGNRQSTTTRDPRLRPETAVQRRATSDCAPDSDSEDEPTSTPAPVSRGVSPHYTDPAGRRIYPEPYQCHPSPAGSSTSSREYNPCGRNDDDREHQAPCVEDSSDDEEGRGEQAPYVEDASDNENEDFLLDEQPGIEAPYRPHDDPIVTFPPSPVRLYVMGPDETEVAEDLGVQTERSVYLNFTHDEEMGPGPPTALSRGPSTTLSLGTSTTQDEPSPQRYPTGKAIEWESEPSDDEENTEQRLRRKEPTSAPTFSGRGPDAEVIAHNSHPQTTPTSSPSDTLMGISPTTLNLLLEETLPEMENRWWEPPSEWDSGEVVNPHPEATAPNEGRLAHESSSAPGGKLHPLPAGYTCNTTDGQVSAAARRRAARVSRQRFRIPTEEGSYQVTLKPNGAGNISFLPRSIEGM